MQTLRIGIDVGGMIGLLWPWQTQLTMQGTNTDAVLISNASTMEDSILAWHKTTTSLDVTSGIGTAILELLRQVPVNPNDVICVTIWTTVSIPFVPSHHLPSD